MARIPESEIQRLKDEVAVQRLVESAGIELKKVGKDLAGRCPFHADDTASLVVTPAKNLWHCFGCGAAGGPIDWVMKLKGVSFRHAALLLKEDSSLAAVPGEPVKRSTVRALPAPVVLDADDRALALQVVDYYHQTLKQSPEALTYLQSRGLSHPELIDHFKLGFANRTLGLRLPEKNRKAGADIRTRLEKLGIYRESGHEHFNGSLIVPILDAHGDVLELYGRKLLDNLRAGTPKHLYLPSREGPDGQRTRGVFNVQALGAHKEIILCEALIDALTFWCAGYRNVTTAYGVEGFTDDMLTAFKAHGIERVLIAFDRDEAGERGAAKVAAQLQAAGMDVWRIQFPKGMDANEYAQKVTPAAKSLGLLIRKALWLGQGKSPEPPEVSASPRPPELPKPPPAPNSQAKQAASPRGTSVTSSQNNSNQKDGGIPPLAADPVSDTPLPASPVPDSAPPELPCEVKDHGNGVEITLNVGDRRYRVRGLAKNLSFELLKVNLLVSRVNDPDGSFYVDTLDLYAARQRHSYIAHAALELQLREDILKADLGRVLMRLEALQEDSMAQTLERAPVGPQMSPAEHAAALDLLQSPELVARILADFATCGLVGEDTNKLVGYLAAISRKLDKPLGVVVQSSSAAGKTTLMDAVLAFVPEEDKVKYSAMTGQSLFYMGETNLKHKALAIVEEEGASRASYALKLLQSEGELTIASTGKDPQSGNLITQQYRVEGPVALLLTTTARDLDEELMNRCLVLAVDEGRAQTAAIHRLQRERRTLAGLLAKKERQALTTLHQNAQRLLRPLDVLNPYAQALTFPDQTTRLRRDHEKYLTLIDTIALLHQHQRDVKVHQRPGHDGEALEYIEASLADIALANQIAHEVLGRSLDELPPQTRRLLVLIDQYVAGECERLSLPRAQLRFSRRVLREAISWGDTQLRVHLERLLELEYLLAHREGPGGKFVYELVYEVAGQERGAGRAQFAGLLDVATLHDVPTVAKSRGQTPEGAGQSRGDSGPVAAHSRGDELAAEPMAMRLAADLPNVESETHCSSLHAPDTSYTQARLHSLPTLSLAAGLAAAA
ncbi:CHC2 zinc finger domain-containing protein [Polaromonas sp.]|uniref:CHC2 zinc finger domain-containing protein n=1 Tax=Polaromonas sp. TaxID=1869339 RepID=UPI0032662AB6